MIPQKYLTADSLFKELTHRNWKGSKGSIFFSIVGTTVKITHTDIIGSVLQDWVKNYFITKNIYYREPLNSQEFPDFFLSTRNDEHLLEIKSFNYSRNPAFDIANFSSYCETIALEPYKLFADYLIFGYDFDNNFDIEIKDIWLKKIWEIAGTTAKGMYPPLKTQVKRKMIYNIRPNSVFKNSSQADFKDVAEFLKAIYSTLSNYRQIWHQDPDVWKRTVRINLTKKYGTDFGFK